jgi:hypothetical protein
MACCAQASPPVRIEFDLAGSGIVGSPTWIDRASRSTAAAKHASVQPHSAAATPAASHAPPPVRGSNAVGTGTVARPAESGAGSKAGGQGTAGRAEAALAAVERSPAQQAQHAVDVVVAERKAANALEVRLESDACLAFAMWLCPALRCESICGGTQGTRTRPVPLPSQALCAIASPDPAKQRWLLQRGMLPLLARLALGPGSAANPAGSRPQHEPKQLSQQAAPAAAAPVPVAARAPPPDQPRAAVAGDAAGAGAAAATAEARAAESARAMAEARAAVAAAAADEEPEGELASDNAGGPTLSLQRQASDRTRVGRPLCCRLGTLDKGPSTLYLKALCFKPVFASVSPLTARRSPLAASSGPHLCPHVPHVCPHVPHLCPHLPHLCPQAARMLALMASLPEAQAKLRGTASGPPVAAPRAWAGAAPDPSRAALLSPSAAAGAGGWAGWLAAAAESPDCRLASNAARALLHMAALQARRGRGLGARLQRVQGPVRGRAAPGMQPLSQAYCFGVVSEVTIVFRSQRASKHSQLHAVRPVPQL